MKLFKHQEEALAKMKNGSVLCGGVGSGKSITALSYFLKQEKDRALYIITTARKRDTKEWDKECEQVDISSQIVDSWNNIAKYTEIENAFFIFDEQRVVGKGSWVKSFLRITKSNHWILLSATPGDNWSDYIPVFVANGFYKNRTEFVRRHIVYKRFVQFPQIEKYVETKRLARLRSDILVTMDYEKPAERHHLYLTVDYNKELYKRIWKDRWNPYEDRPVTNVSELCSLLRKVTNSDVSRLLQVESITSEYDRVIIFYNFDYELEMLRCGRYRKGTEVAEWNGHKHELIPDSSRWVYLVQYTAGAEGWNCIDTNVILFYSQNYSYKTLEQSCGRIDRLNTPYKDLYYYHLKSYSPIDLAISRSLRDKKTFNESIFVKGGA